MKKSNKKLKNRKINNIELPINKIIYGDCRKITPKFPSNSIDLIIIDPPYITTKENWDKKEVISKKLVRELFRIAKPSCSLYCWCGIGEKSQSLIRWFPIFSEYWYFKDLITWKKQRGMGMRKGWLYTREEIMWFVKDKKQFIWKEKYQYSPDRRLFSTEANKSEYRRFSNIWTDVKEINQSIAKNKERTFHPSQKPIKILRRIIKVHTKKNDVVLDCFMGSGSTGVACKQLGRNFIGIEINKQYLDRASRWIKTI